MRDVPLPAIVILVRAPQRKVLWKVYGKVTGFGADFAGLAASAAVSDRVSATVRGLVIAALILELVPLAFDLIFYRSVRKLRAARNDFERANAAFPGLFAIVAGTIWLPVGVAVADWLTRGFDVDGLGPYVGTVAAVWAANGLVALPFFVRKRTRLAA